jgi:hypothetical protein
MKEANKEEGTKRKEETRRDRNTRRNPMSSYFMLGLVRK